MLAMMEHAKQVRAEVVAAQKQEELEWAASDTASIAAALELQEARRIQQVRSTLEPFLMSKAERQMNAAMLRKLPP